MPTELYETLYGHYNLPLLCTMLKDIYAHKPQAAASSTTTDRLVLRGTKPMLLGD